MQRALVGLLLLSSPAFAAEFEKAILKQGPPSGSCEAERVTELSRDGRWVSKHCGLDQPTEAKGKLGQKELSKLLELAEKIPAKGSMKCVREKKKSDASVSLHLVTQSGSTLSTRQILSSNENSSHQLCTIAVSGADPGTAQDIRTALEKIANRAKPKKPKPATASPTPSPTSAPSATPHSS